MHEIKFSLSDRQLFLLRRIALYMRGFFKGDAELPEAINPLVAALGKAENPPLRIKIAMMKKEEGQG